MVTKEQEIAPAPAFSTPMSEFPLTELGNAERLVHLFGDRMRYTPAFGWLVWDSKRWATDDNKERVSKWYFATIRQIAVKADKMKARAKDLAKAGTDGDDEAAKEASGIFKAAATLRDWAKACESNAKRNSTLSIAEILPGVPVRPSDLDRHQWLLNTQNGTIDLLTGTLHPHDRDNLITKICPVAFDPAATCPLWDKCLAMWQPGKTDAEGTWKDGHKGEQPEDVREFLARAAGYTLTGSTREHSVLFLYGDGGNGKSVFINTLERLLGYTGDGGYATRIPFSALSDERRSGGVTPELARLVGARLVIASEPTAGQRFNDGTLKNLASSDKLTVNPKFKDQFDFDQTHTPWIIGNVKPGLNTTDNGMLRRLPLIPFDVKIAAADKDQELEAKLQAEAPGILAWAVRGCQEWLRRGLDPPPSVIEATADYHEENNPFSGFFESRTIWGNDRNGKPLNATLGEILQAYKSFASKGDDFRMPHEKQFAAALRARGAENKVIRRDGKNTKCWVGVGVTDGAEDFSAVAEEGNLLAEQPSKQRPATSATPATAKTPITHVRAHAHVSNTNTHLEVAGVAEVADRKEPATDSPFACLNNLPKAQTGGSVTGHGATAPMSTLESSPASQTQPGTGLLPVTWERGKLSQFSEEEWQVACPDPDATGDNVGAGTGWGTTKALAVADVLSDPHLTARQRTAFKAEARRLESLEGTANA